MTVDDSILDDIFKTLGSDNILDKKHEFDQLCQNNQNSINTLTQELNDIHIDIENSAKTNEIAEDDIKAEIESTKLEIEAIHNEMKDPINILKSFFKKTNDFTDYTNLELYKKLINISELATTSSENNNNQDMQDMANFIQNESKNFINEVRSTAYSDIESMIRNFSVSNQNALKQIFFTKNTTASMKATRFFTMLENVQIDPDWPAAIAECASRIYLSRIHFHTEKTEVKTNSSTITLIINLLRNTIQSASYVLLAVEKHFTKSDIMKSFTTSIYDGVCDALNDSIEHNNIHSFRTLFTEGFAYDQWANEVEILDLPKLCPLLYDSFGAEWDKLEYEAFKYGFEELLQYNSAEDFELRLATILDGIFKVSPDTLSETQKMRHFRGSFVLCSRHILSQLDQRLRNYDNLVQNCSYINALYMMSIQIREYYDISDQTCQDLLKDSEEIGRKCHEYAQNLGTVVEAYFEQEASTYITRKTINPMNGVVSQEISKAIDTISPMLQSIKAKLHKHLYELSFISTIQKKIDDILYKYIVKNTDFKKKEVVNQFSIDVDALILAIGGDDMRKLRSAKIIITQIEEKFLDVEISESDIQKLMIQAGMGG